MLCACGTALSEGRLSVPHGPSGLVGRVLESEHTAGEPIVAGRHSHPATAAASGLASQVFTGADNAPRVANLAGRDDAAEADDVAAGEGRGVARVAG